MERMKLNIGCGHRLKENWVNIDLNPPKELESVEFGDVESGLRFPSNSASEILLDNVIEHVSHIPKVMSEVFRLLAPGGTVTLITPHFTSHSSWRDPTHIHHLSYFSFDYFFNDSRANYIEGKFKLVSRKLSFSGGFFGLLGRLIFWLSPTQWEAKYCFLLRASTIKIVLEKPAAQRLYDHDLNK